eukprot:TRINITY_DN2721_c0_g1_i11.p1 TRINITY_DN2721_c0_g1~~TRINITY_DN2721_c0_g1_i11.p1  ORF type:complete len:494 (-),score=56.96 TRINITY_DN2721_c0_g1_i11:516-1997(-)
MSAEPNLIPLGDFEFDQKCRIGAGSFATVYSGRSKSTGEPVAIKAVEMRRLNKKLQQNLEVEIAIMRDHCHPNLVKLHSVERGPDDQHVYLVMEFCSGGDLAGFLKKRGGHVPESTAREFTRHIATGIAYLQTHHLIHRDLKPHNLLLSKDSTTAVIKIADFGFARMIEPTALADTMCGSPLYMAPEVLSGQSYSKTADLWSCGTILFQMLTGKPPYHGDNYIHLSENIKKKKWALPEPFVDKISDGCKHLLGGLLQKEPTKRISAQQFLEHPFFAVSQSGILAAAPAEANLAPPPATCRPPPQLNLAVNTHEATKSNKLKGLGELSDDYVLVATPPPGPFKRGGLVLQKGDQGECLMMDSIDRVVSNLMKCTPGQPAELSPHQPTEKGIHQADLDLANASHSQATVVMEIANAMVQHNPRDALALYIKCLQLLKNVINDPLANPQHVIEAQELFATVYDKAETLTKELPHTERGQTAEEILYECALAMVFKT